MASKIKVDQIAGSSGSSVTVPTGQTFTITDGLAIGSLPTVTVAKGGTNLTSFTAGDVLYATGSTTLAKLAKGSDTEVLTLASGVPSWAAPAAGGAWTLIKTLTASTSSDLTFVNGTSDVVLDSTYKHYVFGFNSIHSSAVSELSFQCSIDTGSNYNTNILSNYFVCYVNGSGADHTLEVKTGNQDATSYQRVTSSQGTDDDATYSGELHLFNPASTTYHKQFRSWSSGHGSSEYQYFTSATGRAETGSDAIDAVQFKMASGTIDAGTISLYGQSS